MAHYNPRLAKIHRNYAVEEIATLFAIHKNTVRLWIKREGLPVLDKGRPRLIHGSDLRLFLEERRKKNKKPCKPGEIYCVRCREPKIPLDMKAVLEPFSESQGKLIGSCPHCNTRINKWVSLAKLPLVCGDLDITVPKGLEHLKDTH